MLFQRNPEPQTPPPPPPFLLDRDCHTHTIYSNHADPAMTVENSLLAASKTPLKTLVILEHVPEITGQIKNPEIWYKGRGVRSQLDRIAEDFRFLERPDPDLNILLGVELDADPFQEDGSAMLTDLSGVDFVLGSTHVLPGGERFWFERVHLSKKEGEKMAGRWLDWTIQFIRKNPIDVLAHPGDLVGSCMMLPPFDRPGVAPFFEPLFAAMRETSTAFELNELLGRKLIDPYRRSYPALVTLARQMGVKFSLGSDAHSPGDVGRFEWVVELIHQGGIQEEDLMDLSGPLERRTSPARR